MNYINYRASDFAADEQFIKWVQQPSQEQDAYWEKFLLQNPKMKTAVYEARELVLHLSHDADEVPEWELDEMWQELEQSKKQFLLDGDVEGDAEDNVIPMNFWQRKPWLMAAAIAAILMVSGVLLLQQWQQQAVKVYATKANERMELLLPDSSSVVLSANSSLTMPAKWSVDKDRLVQLEGKAYFSVTHKRNHQRFVVETTDGLKVEVLGTEFSVSNKEEKKQVVLENGKVHLTLNQNGLQQEVGLAPGDMVEADARNGISKKQVDTKLYTAWKNSKLVFDNTTLHEVAQMLEHSYGYKVNIKEPALENERITAYLDKNSPEHILSTLSETLQVEVNKQDKNITISLTDH
ncbi:FecR family protein [Pontibacter rugosus]|uniref:FecR family protein n=1 Tax=Pontibacter rugosus TaxID=1745966 RepID=A0ABW3SNE6_9BACT